VDITKPIDLAKPADLVKTADRLKTADVTKAIDAPKTGDASKTVQLDKTVDITKPIDLAKPADLAKLVDAAKPADVMKTADVTKAIDMVNASDISQSLDSTKTAAHSQIVNSAVNDNQHSTTLTAGHSVSAKPTVADQSSFGQPQHEHQQQQSSKEQLDKQQQPFVKDQQDSAANQIQMSKELLTTSTDSKNTTQISNDNAVDKSTVNAIDKNSDNLAALRASDDSRARPLSAEQAFVINQLMAKTEASGTLSQPLTNEVKLNQEIMAVNRKDFTHSVKEKVMVMINQKINQLEIRLDPAELGSMHVKVNLQNEQAVVSFMVQNAHAKEALEQNIGKLKDMLADNGIDVGESNIEQQDDSAEQEAELSQQSATSAADDAVAEGEEWQQISGDLYNMEAKGVDYYA
jgi:flagellar hook-length control protein FliK